MAKSVLSAPVTELFIIAYTALYMVYHNSLNFLIKQFLIKDFFFMIESCESDEQWNKYAD